MKIIKGVALSPEEEQELYGDRKKVIGQAYADENCENRYYLQRKDDVLHINDDIINLLHVGSLNTKEGIYPIVAEVFKSALKRVLYNLDIKEEV